MVSNLKETIVRRRALMLLRAFTGEVATSNITLFTALHALLAAWRAVFV